MTRYDTPEDDGAVSMLSPAPSVYDTGGFYAVVRITGELPELLLGKPMSELGNGEYLILVTRDEADELIALGYEAETETAGRDSSEAVVIYKR
jgi:hypothetical protein